MPKFCGWPATSLLSSGVEVVIFRPYDFAPNPVAGQDNPPLIVTNPIANNWFAPGIAFPQNVTGGSWAQATYLTPGDTDPAINPFFTIYWSCPFGSTPGVCNWQIHATAHADLAAMSGGGPGTAIADTAAVVDAIQVGPETQIAMTGGTTWGPNKVLNINVYRGNGIDTIVGPSVLIGVRLRFSRL